MSRQYSKFRVADYNDKEMFINKNSVALVYPGVKYTTIELNYSHDKILVKGSLEEVITSLGL